MTASFYCKFAVIVLSLAVFSGCAGGSKEIYYWGGYEDTIHEMYLEPGKASVPDVILRLEEQIEKAAASGQAVPPGVHAHLAYLYTTDGDLASAKHHFQTEKEKYPESADFIDGILERMKR